MKRRGLLEAIRFGIALAATLALAGTAWADMTFRIRNASGGPAGVTGDAHAAYSPAGAAPATFQPGNLEMVETGRIDASGACIASPPRGRPPTSPNVRLPPFPVRRCNSHCNRSVIRLTTVN